MMQSNSLLLSSPTSPLLNDCGTAEAGIENASTSDAQPTENLSLPILCDSFITQDTLLSFLYRNNKSRTFLQFTANYWSVTMRKEDDSTAILHKIYSTFVFLSLCVLLTMMVFAVSVDLVTSKLSEITVSLTVALDIMSVLPSQYLNQMRMRHKAYIQDSSVIDESVRIATYFGVFCACSIALSIAILVAGGDVEGSGVFSNIILLTVVQPLISLYLTFNLLFLMMDLKVSSLLIDQLFILADHKILTVSKFNMVRNDIRRRDRNSKLASDFIIAPCLASVIAILVLVFRTDKDYVFITSAWAIALTKELMFIFVAFWYVAKVNGKADLLTAKLSTSEWAAERPLDVQATLAEFRVHHNEMKADMQRMTICVSCITDPIRFTLLFKRVTWQDVAVSAAGFGATIVVGIIKIIVGAQ